MESFSIYEKIRDIVPDSMISNKVGIFMHQCLEKEEEFIDPVYAPTMENLEPLKRSQMSFISWFRIKNFFKDGNFCLFNDIRMRNQMLRDRGFSYLADALNSLSSQPGLVIRLFEYTETNFQGIYSIWVNLNGLWKEVLIDDYIPIYSNQKGGKAQFHFASPSQDKREVWAILLQKALARAYGGFHALYNGNTTYILRDLTGAPVVNKGIVYISEKQKITEREESHMAHTWKKIVSYLGKGYVLTFVPRAPNKVESNRNKYLKVFNKKMFLGKGIYSGHDYAVVSARSVRNSKGQESRVVQLRNPWINEEWEGDFSKNSDLWTDEIKQQLNYNPQKGGTGQFWMPISALDFSHLGSFLFNGLPDKEDDVDQRQNQACNCHNE
jgi:calpain-15